MGKQFKKSEGTTGSVNKKETIMDFSPYIDKEICVHFSGGREIIGILKGFDQVSNLVMDNAFEILRDANSVEKRRKELGLIIVRGPNISTLFPSAMVECENPYQK